MRYYKTKYEISVHDYGMINEKGLDLSHMLKKKTRLTEKKKQILYKAYLNILFSFDNMDTSMIQSFIKWKTSYIWMRANTMIKSKEVIKDHEKDFRQYLENIEKNYKDFELTEYFFNPDWMRIISELNLEPEMNEVVFEYLGNFKNIRFYTWDEYFIFCSRYPELLALTLSEQFKSRMIISRKIKIQSLIDLDTYLLDIYSNNEMYDLYQSVRWQMFNLEVLKCDPKELFSFFKEVAMIKDITFNFDNKTTMMSEYEKIKEVARQKAEANKPQADDIKIRENGRV